MKVLLYFSSICVYVYYLMYVRYAWDPYMI